MFPKIDIYASVAGIICLTLLLSPLYKHTDDVSLLRIVGVGVDNIAHLRLVRMTDSQHGYVYGNKEVIKKEMIKDISAYPQGAHLNTSIIEGLIWPSEKVHTYRQTLLIYIFLSAIFFSLVAYLFTYLILLISDKLDFRRRGVAPAIAILSSIFLICSLLIDIFWLGFFTQIFSIFLSLVLLLILIDASSSEEKNSSLINLVFALLICAGVGFAYVFALPVMLVSTGIIILTFLVKQKKQIKPATIIPLVGLFCISLIPAWIQITYMQQSNKLNDHGGALKFDGLIVAAIAVLAIMYFGYLRKQIKSIGSIQILLLVAFGFMSAVFLYQKVTAGGESSYYFYKSTYLVLILAVLAIGILLISLLQNL